MEDFVRKKKKSKVHRPQDESSGGENEYEKGKYIRPIDADKSARNERKQKKKDKVKEKNLKKKTAEEEKPRVQPINTVRCDTYHLITAGC